MPEHQFLATASGAADAGLRPMSAFGALLVDVMRATGSRDPSFRTLDRNLTAAVRRHLKSPAAEAPSGEK